MGEANGLGPAIGLGQANGLGQGLLNRDDTVAGRTAVKQIQNAIKNKLSLYFNEIKEYSNLQGQVSTSTADYRRHL